VYFWAVIRKNRARFSPSRGIQEEEIAAILRDVVIIEKDAKEATDDIMKLSGIKKYVDRLRSADEKEHFQRHLRKYVNMYLPDCPFEVTTTNRYTIDTHEASVTARKEIRKGDIVKYLSGIQVAITEEQFKALSRDDVRLDFSIVHSSRKKAPSLFLGPARFANHDCNANARLSTTGSHGMQVIATRDIAADEEITVTYGTDYFGEDNCECLCMTCERLRRNGWARHTGDTNSEVEDEQDKPTEEVDLSAGYSLRRKRKSDALDADSQTSQSSTPKGASKRQKLSIPAQFVNSRQSTPRGRRTLREVTIKTEHPLARSVQDLPAVTVQAQAHVEAQVAMQSQPQQSIRQCRSRALRASSDESNQSRSSSAATSSVFSAPSTHSQATGVTSDGEVMESIIVRLPPQYEVELLPSPEDKTIGSSTVNIDVKTTASITPLTHYSEDSDSELTSISQFSTDSTSHKATRMTKQQVKRKKAWNRELAALREGSMERSLVEELEEPAAILTTETDITISTSGRQPGDYTLTSKLLCGAYSRWVQCHTCDADFVQDDAYLTRKECPRCERHSKLYGYAWPKTDREGKWDTEERVLDHREVHRFVEPSEEKKIKKGGKKSLQIEAVKSQRVTESMERSRSVSQAGAGLALEGSPRRGRRNRRSRLTM
jgi:histone-lysine N-methyltransferase SUV420H